MAAEFGLAPGSPGELGGGEARSWAEVGRSEVVTRYKLPSKTTPGPSGPLRRPNRANANTCTHLRTSHGLHVACARALARGILTFTHVP